jgi:hypothetical protein
MTELRYRVLRLLDERENAGKLDTPTVGEVAQALDVPLRDVLLVLETSEAMGMVALRRYHAAAENDYAVVLRSPAFTYLESKGQTDR